MLSVDGASAAAAPLVEVALHLIPAGTSTECTMCGKVTVSTKDATEVFCSQQCESFYVATKQKGFGVKLVGTCRHR